MADIDLESEHVLLRVPTEPQCCHQGGDLEWGPDSTLYLSTGDNGMSEVRPGWKMSEEQLAAFVDTHCTERLSLGASGGFRAIRTESTGSARKNLKD